MKTCLFARAIFVVHGLSFFAPPAVAAPTVVWGPVVRTIEVKNCTTNAAQASSVLVTLDPQGLGIEVTRFSFRNISTGQVHNTDYPHYYGTGTLPRPINLPGGRYTMKVSDIMVPSGNPVPNKTQIVFETAIVVPHISGGNCTMPAPTENKTSKF